MPLARPGLSAVPLDDNVAIYDEVGHVLVMLNASASAVLERCDGQSTFEAIVAELAEDHDADLDTVREDVRQTLRKLASIGLVADAN
jgi:predicted deacylase